MMQPVCLQHEASRLMGELCMPQGSGKYPGVLVAHSGLGLLAHERKIASDLAALGYAALAIDMFGTELDGSPEQAGAYFAELVGKPELLRSRMRAWYGYFANRPEIDASRIAAIGYCFGGMCVLELAREGTELKAAVSFHGLLSTKSPAQAGIIRGMILAYCGGNDPYSPREQIEAFRMEMAAANAKCQVTVFDDVLHGFSDPAVDALDRPGIGYNAAADKASWKGTVALLDSVLKS